MDRVFDRIGPIQILTFYTLKGVVRKASVYFRMFAIFTVFAPRKVCKQLTIDHLEDLSTLCLHIDVYVKIYNNFLFKRKRIY